MRSPSEQVSEGQLGTTELLIEPDTKVVQRHPRRQTCSQSLKLMGPLPPQTKGVEQLVVGTLYDLADGGHPSPQMLGPGLERVSFGRMDDARPVALSPAAVVLCSFETFIGYVGARGGRSYTAKASVRLSPHSKESLRHLLIGGGGGSKAETRDDSGGICSGEQRKAFVPSQAVGPSDVGLSSKPSMSSAFTVSGGHRRTVQRLVRALLHLKKSYQVQGESLDELRVRAHQPIELGTLGKRGESICEVGLGVAVEVPLAGEARPAGEEGEGYDLARTERWVWSWLPFWSVALAEVIDHDVECSEEGVHIEHEELVPFPSGLGGKPTLECGHLPLKFYTGNSHQAFKRQSIGPEETFEFYTDAGLWMWLDPFPDFNQVRPREYTVGLVDIYPRAPVPAKVTVKYLDQSTSMPVDFTTEANMPFRLSFANLAQGQRKTYVPTIRLEVQEPAHSWVGPGELRVNNDMESLYKMVGYGIEPDPDPDPYRFIR